MPELLRGIVGGKSNRVRFHSTSFRDCWLGSGQEIKDAMERTESLVSKQLTQDLHRATTSMGKAQKTLKELMDSKERHRLQWLQHLAESLKGWQQQLESYDAKQEEFVVCIQKARKDMESAHVLIQKLNAKAAGKAVPELQDPIPVDTAQDMSHIKDPEERNLRKQLHSLLASCATKMELKVPETTVPTVVSSDEEKDGDGQREKRQRAASPAKLADGQVSQSMPVAKANAMVTSGT